MPPLLHTTVLTLCGGILLAVPAMALDNGQVAINGVVSPHLTLAEALAAASAGDRIELGSGIWPGVIDIAVPVTLTGIDTGGGLPTIDGETSRTAITVSAEGVALESLHVTTSGARPHPFGLFQSLSEEGCIVVRANGATIRDSFLDGCHYGIYVVATSEATIENNSIEKNTFGGIFIRNSQRVEVVGNRLHSNGHSGIDVGTVQIPPGTAEAWQKLAPDVVLTADPRYLDAAISQYIEIRDNSVVGHGLGGIGVGYARYVAVIGNVVTDNGGWPLPEVYPPVQNSTTAGVAGHGIAFTCATNQDIVQANIVTNNRNIGILLDGAFHVRVEANEVSGSEHGIALYGAYSNGVLGNRVSGNGGTGIRIERGAATNPPSIGNLVVGNSLVGNGLDGYDSSGSDTGPAADAGAPFQDLPADLAQPNRWDNGGTGNHYEDFDVAAEGFTDADANGVSEAPHPIPGGLAVDHHPLDAERIGTAAVPAPEEAPAGAAARGCGGCSIELALAPAACPV